VFDPCTTRQFPHIESRVRLKPELNPADSGTTADMASSFPSTQQTMSIGTNVVFALKKLQERFPEKITRENLVRKS
jgi:hypothetical protein